MLKENIRNIGKILKTHIFLFVVGLIFSYIIYNILISNSLVNSNDGLWEYNYYKAGSWSLSLGRWFWLYLDRLRFGISTEPLTSIIALSFFSIGFVFIADIFEMGKRKVTYLSSLLFLSSTVVCISLSYRFMSPTFGLAFLFSILSVWILTKWKGKILSIIISGLLLALSMGLYQAYLGCTCILLVGYYIFILQRAEYRFVDVIKSIGRAFLMAIVGGVWYIIVLNLHLKVFHVAMSSYNGANSYSVSNMISSLGWSFRNTYQTFVRYFFENYYKLNVLQNMYIFYIAYVLLAIVLIIGFVKTFKQSKRKAVLYMCFIVLVPVASNAVLLVATQAWTGLLMTAAMALCFPVFLLIIDKIDISKGKIIYKINVVILLLMLYGNIYQVQIDQQAMLEGQIATTTMASDIIHDLSEEGYLDSNMQYCFLGVPAGNELFGTSVIYQKANSDAMFGAWYRDTSCNRRSWQGVFTYLCGMNIQICDADGYQMVIMNEETKDMPIYPQDGYICQMGNIIVVKVSE